jgi:hypothetical protein
MTGIPGGIDSQARMESNARGTAEDAEIAEKK